MAEWELSLARCSFVVGAGGRQTCGDGGEGL
jgi:hypothetical protein